MNNKILRLGLAASLALGLLASGGAPASEYIYRDLMGNTLPSARCLAQAEAVAHAQDAYLVQKKEKVFCETQGYGWHVAEEKNPGKLVCQPCEGGGAEKVQCHLEDVVVACKRLKPGSVGLIPGKG